MLFSRIIYFSGIFFLPFFLLVLAASAADEMSFETYEAELRKFTSTADFNKALTVSQTYAEKAKSSVGKNSLPYANAISWMAFIQQQGLSRNDLSLPLFEEAMAIYRRILPKDSLITATASNNLAFQYQSFGRYEEAETLLNLSLSTRQKKLPAGHIHIAQSLSNLARNYVFVKRLDEAVKLHRRAHEMMKKIFKKDHSTLAASYQNYGSVLELKGELKVAEGMFRKALAIRHRIQHKNHPELAGALAKLAENLFLQKEYDEAVKLFRSSLKIRAISQRAEHYDTSFTWLDLGRVFMRMGRYANADDALGQALAIRQKILPASHPSVATILSKMALVAHFQNQTKRALGYARNASKIYIERRSRDSISRGHFENHLVIVWQAYLATNAPKNRALLLDEALLLAQRTDANKTAATVARMSARLAASNKGLEMVVRNRQDLNAKRALIEKQYIAALSENSDAARQLAIATQIDLSKVTSELNAAEQRIKDRFPEYASLVRPEPLQSDAIQSLLTSDEAVIKFLVAQNELFIWVITSERIIWTKSPMKSRDLSAKVAILRAALEAESVIAGPYFDLGVAHQIYRALFAFAENSIKLKSHLLVAPSGPLTKLPLHLLVTHQPTNPQPGPVQFEEFRKTKWLARRHAITVLPAVSSLKALRRVARKSRAGKRIIGFGNPLLEGPDSRFKIKAELARKKQSCTSEAVQQVAMLIPGGNGVGLISTRGGVANASFLMAQVPLPETADELCAIADELRVDPKVMRLGARATERNIKSLSKTGELAQYRILHFATHGTLAGEVTGSTEAGLILTPPKKSTLVDDGFLTATEIADLRLDADWVILSACNTAAGGANSAEALAGLARSFFYAGARALLVSHWSVYSDTTVKLIVAAVRGISKNKNTSRAEALRLSMLDIIDNGELKEAHPSYWAPFVVVGEGSINN